VGIEPLEIELAGDQKGNDSKITKRPKASRLGLGRLNQRIQTLQKTVVQMTSFPL
jgi:hypothetical protein